MENKVIALDSKSSFPTSEIELFGKYESLLAILFCASDDEEYIKTTVKNIKDALPNVKIIGTSADEAIAKDEIYSNPKIVLSLLGFEKTVVKTSCKQNIKDSFELGKSIAKEIIQGDTKAIIAFADADHINGEEFLNGATEVADGVIIAGGMSSTVSFSNTFVVFEDTIIKNGAVAVSLSSDELRVKSDYAFGWKAIGQEMIVTSADKNKIESIDSKPPLDVFAKYLGQKVMEGFPGLGVAFPLMIKRGDLLVARGIIGIDNKNLIVSGNVKTGDRVYIGYGNQNEIIEQNNIATHMWDDFGKPDALFIFSCDGRKLFLPRKVIEYETKHLGQFENVSGFFTLGEFYTKDRPTHLNFSLTALAISEQKNQKNGNNKYKKTTAPAADVSATVSDGLFHFIDVRASELDYLAYHDALTELPNRLLLFDRAEHAMALAKKQSKKLAIVLINLDGFKLINETLGHMAGDEILKIVSKRISAALGDNNTLARVGDDEFVALLENINAPDAAAQTAASIIKSIYKPINISNKELKITSSLGIAIYPSDADSYQTLIQHADAAMHKAKLESRNSFMFYKKELTAEVEKRLEIQNELRMAIERDEFVLFYQPQFRLTTKELSGVEALIRWKHPRRGLVMPDFFIPEAENCGLIVEIGKIVTDIACRDIRNWLGMGFRLPQVSINVAADEFSKDNLPKRLHTVLNSQNLDPWMLGIEITETGIMKNEQEAVKELQKIDSMGISIAMDDFGTGHSSLSYIHKLPISLIKIDRSFISDITDSSSSSGRAIIKAVKAISKELGISVLAEGIEDEAQLNFLINEECDYGQGYLFGRPIPPEEFTNLLTRNS